MMRRTAWILAAVGLAGGSLSAQDRPRDSFLPRTPKPALRAQADPGRGEDETAAKAPKPTSQGSASSNKNYYDELFGEAAAGEAASAPQPKGSLTISRSPRTAAVAAEGDEFAPAPVETGKVRAMRSGLRTVRPVKSINPFLVDDAESDNAEREALLTKRSALSASGAYPGAEDPQAEAPASLGKRESTFSEAVSAVEHAEARQPADAVERNSILPVQNARPFPGSSSDSSMESDSERFDAEPVQPAGARRRANASLTDAISTERPRRTAAASAPSRQDHLPEIDFTSEAPQRVGAVSAPAAAVTDEVAEAPSSETPVVEANPFAAAGVGRHVLERPIEEPPVQQEKSVERTRRRPAATPQVERAAEPVHDAARAAGTSAGVTAEWVKKSDITIGQECSCDLVIKNQTGTAVADVEVSAALPASVELLSAEPVPQDSGMVWKLGSMAIGETRTIGLRMIPHERGRMDAQAFVRFSNVAATQTFSVAEPLLAIEMSGPTEVMVGDSASQTVTVFNPGTGVATNVTVEARIPDGLEHARGKRLVMDLGALNPGESRPVRLALAAINGGRHVVEVKAHADGDLVKVAASEVSVVAPRLRAAIQGPSLRYLGRQAVYTLVVSNAGGAGTDNVRVMHKVPEGFEFISCDKGGRYDASTRLLNWFVGAMGEDESAEAHVTLKAEQAGSFTHFIRATSEHGIVCDAQVTTQVEGTASLVLRVKDLDDPVETGAETAYEIKVTNEGTAAAQGVALTCELPETVTLTSANGPTAHQQRGRNVSFLPLTELAPGETAMFRVFVRGEAPGNLRFKANLTSESVVEPLTAEELTKVYGE